ncbi:MAG: hydrogenase formation protein HypD [Anaerolineae bacterium]
MVSEIHVRAAGLRPLTLMEFCGGHTHAIGRNGIRQSLPANVRLLSGPGCPVCVTSQEDIDRAIAIAGLDDVILASFGDMLRVPGSNGSLLEARAQGADVRIVYSAMDALQLAAAHPERMVVFLGIGFETTAPGVAVALLQAQAAAIRNFLVFSLHKLTPPAMRAIIQAGEVSLDGIIGPGHVTTIIGAEAWEFLPREFALGCAISGFEPTDMLLAIKELVSMAVNGKPMVANCYSRSVTARGNLKAQETMARVFEAVTVPWRGLGVVPASGLKLRPEFELFDAEQRLSVPDVPAWEPAGCHCGEVLRGVMTPEQCSLFASACTPVSPVGPCMVSSEGACAAHYELAEQVD